MLRLPIPDTVSSTGVVAVLRAQDAAAYIPVVRALAGAGVTSIELTLTTPGTVEQIPALLDAVPHAEIGVGTVLSREQAEASLDAGAHFLVTPAVKPEVIATALARATPVIAGALTPTEVNAAWEYGASAVKIFPASTVGAEYIRHLKGPYPDLVAIPSGGIALEDVGAWISVGCAGVSLGGPLLVDALTGGDLKALARRARQALNAVRAARQ